MPAAMRFLLLPLLLSILCSTTAAQTPSEARETLLRHKRFFDLSSDEKRQNSVAGFITAALKGEQRIVELYLAAGMDINARDEYLQTALYAATAERRYPTALMLLSRGADPNLATDKAVTPLHAAIILGEYDSTRHIREPQSTQLINALLDKGANVNARGFEGTTPLIEAARLGDVETIKLLLSRGADISAKDDEGKTALDIAAKELRGLAVQTLIERGGARSFRQRFLYFSYRFARLLGWMLPVLIGLSFLVGYFGKKLTRPKPRRNAVTKGDELPHLAPLKCERCGAGVPLHAEEMQCPRCDNRIPVPEDYAATVQLREKAGRQVARAVEAWRRANLFTIWPIRWTLWLLAPVVLVIALIGSFNNIGNSLFAINTFEAFLALFALLGGLSFFIALWAYAFYLNGTRKRLPVMPAVSHVGEAELANCQLCGGGIEYKAGDLVTLCGYCGGETYRVQLTRRARQQAAQEKEEARLSLYDAMVEISERRQRAFKYLTRAATAIFFIALSIAIIFL